MNSARITILLIIISFNLLISQTVSQNPAHRKIAGFGSSVCSGTGDMSGSEGYIGQLKRLMAKKGWQVVNTSRGGDNTNTIKERFNKEDKLKTSDKEIKENQYLIQQNPDYVLIGLSLANQGILQGNLETADSASKSFADGMRELIEKCRNAGLKVVIANCYSNNQFAPGHYIATKKMNISENKWGVPVFNLLGTIDDGKGHWVKGFYNDDWHPSYGGHKEMFFAIVPSVFGAIEKGKNIPVFEHSYKFARISSNGNSALEFIPEDTIHSFTVSVKIKCGDDLTAVAISGKKGVLSIVDANKMDSGNTYEVFAGNVGYNGVIEIKNGIVSYKSGSGEISALKKIGKESFHNIILTHLTASGKSALYIDGQFIGEVKERIVPGYFSFGILGTGDYKDIMVYRSSLNEDEVQALTGGNMIHASLELYAPLSDGFFHIGAPVLNKACSLSEIIVKGAIEPK